MNSPIIMPKHFFVSQGQLVEKNSVEMRSSPPKVVDYVHTIRILSNNCEHEPMIKGLHESYHQRLLEKDREIEDLNRVIQVRDEQLKLKSWEIRQKDQQIRQKDQQIRQKDQEIKHKDQDVEHRDSEIKHKDQEIEQRDLEIKQKYQEIKHKDEEIERYQEKVREMTEAKLELSVIEPSLQKSIIVETNKLKISSIMNHTQLPSQSEFLGEFSRQKETEEDNEQILKIKKQMKNTQQALSSITSLLQKPKKKYQFFNSNLRQSKSQLQSPCVSQKLSDSNFRSQVFISNKKQATPFCEMDLSISKTDESRDNFDFIAQTANQDPVVSSFLVNWQSAASQQVNMMKQQDDETKLTINMDSQNDKRQMNNLNQSIVDLLEEDEGNNMERSESNDCKYLQEMRCILNSTEGDQGND